MDDSITFWVGAVGWCSRYSRSLKLHGYPGRGSEEEFFLYKITPALLGCWDQEKVCKIEKQSITLDQQVL